MMTIDRLIAAILGLVFGSFMNVVILRFNNWRSILSDRSHCPNCKQTLRWYDLIPVFSYVSLLGKCRYCRKPISWQYPVVELGMGILFYFGYNLVFGANLPLYRLIIAVVLLIAAFGSMALILFQDLSEMSIPDQVAYFLLVAAVIFSWVFYDNLVNSLYGALIGVLPIALLVYPSRGKWMGEGDVKLALALGFLVGYPSSVVYIIAAFVSGGVYGAIAMATKRAQLRSAVPFAPFLILGAIVALIWGAGLVHWYLGLIGYGYTF